MGAFNSRITHLRSFLLIWFSYYLSLSSFLEVDNFFTGIVRPIERRKIAILSSFSMEIFSKTLFFRKHETTYSGGIKKLKLNFLSELFPFLNLKKKS